MASACTLRRQAITISYRPDIDGLRAFAVLSVVLFHAFPDRLRGGFVGVDVFFVISGYLISSIIFLKLARGTFSFADFYTRRIKRIFPALLLVMLSCLIFGWFVLLADEFVQLGKHTVAGTGFIANLVFWGETGYFNNAAETKPLLHLWSLGIEEQFYIFWPLLVWLVWRSNLGLLITTVVVLAASFAFNIYSTGTDTIAAFYSPLTRIWELSVGSLLVWLALHAYVVPSEVPPRLANILSFAGASLLLLAIAVIDRNQAFPGWWVLLPVMGTALLITAGPHSWLNRHVLSNRVIVWFGLISYPLYLWHWPLLSFGQIIEGDTPGETYRALAVVVAILLAWLSFRFVENRIRKSPGRQYVVALLIGGVLIAGGGAYVYLGEGIPARGALLDSGFTAEVSQQFTVWNYSQNDYCTSEYAFSESNALPWWFCMKSAAAKPTIVLLGNSFANQLYPGLIKNPLLGHHTILSIGACPFTGRANFHIDGDRACEGQALMRQVNFIEDLIARENSVKFAIIAGVTPEPVPNAEIIERMRQRIDYLEARGIRVIVFTPHMMAQFDPKTCFSRPLHMSTQDCSFPVSERAAQLKKFQPLIESISRTNPKVLFFDQNDIYCNGEKCSYVLNGIPLLRDSRHISEFGSIEMQSYFSEWAKQHVPEIFAPALVKQSESKPVEIHDT